MNKIIAEILSYTKHNARHISLVVITSLVSFLSVSAFGAIFFLTRTEVINAEIDHYYREYPGGGVLASITSANAQDDFSYWRPNMDEFSKSMSYSTYNKAYYISMPTDTYSPMMINFETLGREETLPVIGLPANQTWMSPTYLGMDLLAVSETWYVESNTQMFITQGVADDLLIENSLSPNDYGALVDLSIPVKTGVLDREFSIAGVIFSASLGQFSDRYTSRFAIVGSNSVLYWFRNLEIHITMGTSSKSNYLFLRKIIQTCSSTSLYTYDFRELRDNQLVQGMVQEKYASTNEWFATAHYAPTIIFALLALFGVGAFVYSSVDYIERTKKSRGLLGLTSFQLVYLIVTFSFTISSLIMLALTGMQLGSLVFLPFGISAATELIAIYISLLIILKLFIFLSDRTKHKKESAFSEEEFDTIEV